MRDVSDTVQSLEPAGVWGVDASGKAAISVNAVLPGAGIGKFGWRILDKDGADGISYGQVPYSSAGVTVDNRASVAGRVFALARDEGTTRLFFVWVPGLISRRLTGGTLPDPLNFHLLFHPPTVETEYTECTYWDGKRGSDSIAHYLRLGNRYLATDFKAVAHHLLAVASKEPNLAYVVPVADKSGNFGDITQPAVMKKVFLEIYDFLSRVLRPSTRPQFDTIGRVMVTVYSRSGNRLIALLQDASEAAKSFRRQHLMQLNLLDINLGNNEAGAATGFYRPVALDKGVDGSQSEIPGVCVYGVAQPFRFVPTQSSSGAALGGAGRPEHG